MSSVAANDLFLNLTKNNILKSKERAQQLKIAHHAGQVILILMGGLTFWLVIDPPALLAIFGQVGIYAIVTASLAPILCGIFFPNLKKTPVIVAVFSALAVYFILYALAFFQYSDWAIKAFSNPAVPAVYGIFLSLAITVPAGWYSSQKNGNFPTESKGRAVWCGYG